MDSIDFTEIRTVGELIRFEPGDAVIGVGVRSPQSPPLSTALSSSGLGCETFNLEDAGSNPVNASTLELPI